MDHTAEGERRLIAVDEAAEEVNGREVCAWAAMGVDTRELPAIEARPGRVLHRAASLGPLPPHDPLFLTTRSPAHPRPRAWP